MNDYMQDDTVLKMMNKLNQYNIDVGNIMRPNNYTGNDKLIVYIDDSHFIFVRNVSQLENKDGAEEAYRISIKSLMDTSPSNKATLYQYVDQDLVFNGEITDFQIKRLLYKCEKFTGDFDDRSITYRSRNTNIVWLSNVTQFLKISYKQNGSDPYYSLKLYDDNLIWDNDTKYLYRFNNEIMTPAEYRHYQYKHNQQ